MTWIGVDGIAKELTERARALFPPGPDGSPSTPCWSDVGPGWVAPVCRALEAIAQVDPGARVAQVKQKFCGLRLYVDCSDDATEYQSWLVDKIVSAAEKWCWQVCEECGTQIEPHGQMSGIALCAACRASAR